MKKGTESMLSLTAGVMAGVMICLHRDIKKRNSEKEMSDKLLSLFLMMDQWVNVKQEGKNLSEYFQEKGYKKIAIYGMSYAGIALVKELKNTNTEVKYGIDKNADNLSAPVNVFSMESELEEVDAVIVTAVFYFDQIEDELRQKFNCPILSLEDILYEV